MAAGEARRAPWGMVLVVAAAAIFGTVGTARVLGPDASSWSVAAPRLLLGGAALVVAALLLDGGARLGPLLRRPATLVAGGGQLLFQVTFLGAVELTGVAIGTLVAIGSAPVFSGLLTRSTERTWMVATGLAVAGVALLTAGGARGVSAYGVLVALGAGLGYALYTAASRTLAREGEPPTAVAAAGFVVAAALSAPALALTDLSWLGTAAGLAMVLYLGIIATTVAYLLFVAGLRHVAAPQAQTLGLAEPVVAVLLGVVVLDERLEPAGLAGALLVVAGIAVLARGTVRDRRESTV